VPKDSRKAPWFPAKELTYGSLYFYIKGKSYNVNPFDYSSIQEAKALTLKEAREASPSYKLFLKAAIAATGLSERTIKTLLYQTIKDTK